MRGCNVYPLLFMERISVLTNYKVDFARLDSIIKRTIETINKSKTEIYDIAETSRKECKKLEEELNSLKQQSKKLIEEVDILERKLKASKQKLMLANKNFSNYTQEELKDIYEKADNLRVELAVKREMEQFMIHRRNELEIRIKDTVRIVQKADNLITQVGTALSYLSGDLSEVTCQLADLQQRQNIGYRIIKAQEEERRRVARDIHDGPAQIMTNVIMKAEICERMLDDDTVRAKEELKIIKNNVRECLQDVRKIIYNLRPMSLDDLGLKPSLQKYILTYQEETGLTVSFKINGDDTDIKPVISITVFRIVQEALSNVKKHANANYISITISIEHDMLKLDIADDGAGFDTKILEQRSEDIDGGFGLTSMRERVSLLKGDMSIESQKGKGTRLKIILPFMEDKVGSNGED